MNISNFRVRRIKANTYFEQWHWFHAKMQRKLRRQGFLCLFAFFASLREKNLKL